MTTAIETDQSSFRSLFSSVDSDVKRREWSRPRAQTEVVAEGRCREIRTQFTVSHSLIKCSLCSTSVFSRVHMITLPTCPRWLKDLSAQNTYPSTQTFSHGSGARSAAPRRAMLVGRMSANVKLARLRKAQKSTGSTTAQSGTRSDGRSQRLSGSGSKKRKHQRRSGSGKEVLLCILSVKANGTEVISV